MEAKVIRCRREAPGLDAFVAGGSLYICMFFHDGRVTKVVVNGACIAYSSRLFEDLIYGEGLRHQTRDPDI